MSPTAKLSHSEIIPSKLGFSSTVETLTDGHGTCVSFLVSTEHVETGESIGDFDTANVTGDDTIQFASDECSYIQTQPPRKYTDHLQSIISVVTDLKIL